jgi:hypothetical protein
MLRRITLALALLFGGALHVSAADQVIEAPGAAPIAGAIARAATDAGPTVTLWTLSQTPKRPGLLPVLYGTYAGLQVMDTVSTRKAIAAGAREANPLMQKGGMAATVAIKAASGVGMVYVSEKMWKKHRVGAIVLMAAMNGVSAAVVAHNNRNASASGR